MENDNGTNRRSMLKKAGTAVGLGMLAAGTGGCAGGFGGMARRVQGKCPVAFDNDTYYNADGTFCADKAKDAYISLMKYHGYPVYPEMKEKVWASDYGTGQFATLGLGARMWMNNVKDRYMLMDLFLMPGQMLPEHWHLDGEGKDAGNPAKLEGWLIRYGLSYVVGIGEDNLAKVAPDIVIPKCHMDGKTTTAHCVKATPGTFVPLAEVKSRHWQFAGPDGAIITEVANCHTDSAVRHSDKAINDNFLGV